MLTGTRWCVFVLGAVLVGVCACSDNEMNDAGTAGLTAAGADTSVATPAATSDMPVFSVHEMLPAFEDLAESMVGIPLFGVRSLPEGVVVAEDWWPVIEGQDEMAGEWSDANPHIVGEGGEEAEGQVVLSSGTGWLVILENYRGDLGEVTGESVGSVAGRSAFLYEVNGGWLVQWAFDGRWYGVFGRDVDAEAVKTLALDMVLLKDD